MRGASIFAVTMAAMVAASEFTAGYSITGRGTLSCEAWTAARRYPKALDTVMNEQWVVGFLSGIGFMALGELDPLHNVDAGFVYAWVDSYCRNHPSEKIVDAVGTLIQEHPR